MNFDSQEKKVPMLRQAACQACHLVKEFVDIAPQLVQILGLLKSVDDAVTPNICCTSKIAGICTFPASNSTWCISGEKFVL